jgi:ribosome-associated heat shock protein Hsp15
VAGRRGPREEEDGAQEEARQRLDKWLVYARFAKTRSVASELVENGRVRINGVRTTNPARPVVPGDVLTLALPRDTRVVRILGAADRRGSFSVAQGLYEEISPGSGDR